MSDDERMGTIERWTLTVCPACGYSDVGTTPSDAWCGHEREAFELVEVVPASHLRGAVGAERERWLRWATRRTCCQAGLTAAPGPCPWHDDTAPTSSGGAVRP